jgi:hypothetical protein
MMTKCACNFIPYIDGVVPDQEGLTEFVMFSVIH